MAPRPRPLDDRDMDLIGAYLEHLRRAGRTDATMQGRREILCRLNSMLEFGVAQASTDDLAAWLYKDELSQNTKATYYLAIRSFYRWATNPRDPWLDYDPSEDLERVTQARGVARPVTDEQLHKILTEAVEPFRTWATIAAYQGLRCIEISRLDRAHVTEEQLFVIKGKGDKPRVHDTDAYTWAAVRDLPPGPIARTADGERADAFYISMNSAVYFRRKLGLPGCSMHRLRHWLGVTMQREYRDIRVTQKALGHASLTSTQIYTDASDDQLRAARATLPRLA